MASANIWRAAEGPFRRQIWGGELVVYDERSGDTHCLDRIATAVLMRLVDDGPNTPANLRDAVDGLLEAEGKDHGEAIINDALETLGTLQLVRPPHS